MTIKSFALLITSLVLLLAVQVKSQVGLINPAPASESIHRLPTPVPEGYTECINMGGRWQSLGFGGQGCNLPAADAGEPCQSSNECDGDCFAHREGLMAETEGYFPLVDSDAINALNAQDDPIIGYCSQWVSNFSFLILVEDGKVTPVIVD